MFVLYILKNILFFYLFQIYIFILFWCTDVKNKFLKIKNLISMYFQTKNTSKNNLCYDIKQALTRFVACGQKNFQGKKNIKEKKIKDC